MPFCADAPSWEVDLSPGGQSVFLYLTSATPATFSAQLCVLEERACTPVGEIHSVSVVSASYRALRYRANVIIHADLCCSVLAFLIFIWLRLYVVMCML